VILNIRVSGLEATMAGAAGMPAAVRQAMIDEVSSIVVDLQTKVVSEKLHGAVLHQRSGQLAGSIQVQVEATAAGAKGWVFSAGNVKYARFWEMGFSGEEQVRAFTRSASHVFGRAVPTYQQSVAAFTRTVNQAARSFLRSSLTEGAESYRERILNAAVNAMRTSMMGSKA
jgi:hypothetical protein